MVSIFDLVHVDNTSVMLTGYGISVIRKCNDKVDFAGVTKVSIMVDFVVDFNSLLSKMVNSSDSCCVITVIREQVNEQTESLVPQGFELRLFGDSTRYSVKADPYGLCSTFTKPCENELYTVYDHPMKNLKGSMLPNLVSVSSCGCVICRTYSYKDITLYRPNIMDDVDDGSDVWLETVYHQCFSEITSDVIITKPPKIMAAEVGYEASVYCSGKLYVIGTLSLEVLGMIAKEIGKGGNVEDFEDIIKSLPMSVVKSCNTNEELIDLIRRHM